jgi:uncharacterized protein with GYD domain
MKSQSILIVSALAIGLAHTAMAQQPSGMHRYAFFFKYSNQAAKAMIENPQDRAAQAAKLAESFGGRMESIYWFPMGGEYDGMTIEQFPSDATMEALNLLAMSGGNFAKTQSIPLMTSDEFKGAMEKAKSTTTSYTAPTATK